VQISSKQLENLDVWRKRQVVISDQYEAMKLKLKD